MRKSLPPLVPAALFFILMLLLLMSGNAAAWAQRPGLLTLPYFILTVSFLLGLFFTQTRAAYLSIFAAVTVFLANTALAAGDAAQAAAVVFLSGTILPVLFVLLYWLDERGITSTYGISRATGLGAVLLTMLALAFIPVFGRALAASTLAFFRPMSPLIRMPLICFLLFAAAVPALLAPRKHESPLLGPLMALALLFFFAGLNFRSELWENGREQSALLLFASGGAFTLAWTVLESAWWRANIDELTELPGRRALKHHFRCLDSSYAIAVLDIDHFKSVNDTYGHHVGDQVLRFVAAQLMRFPVGTAYRYGGEEFAIVCERQTFDAVVTGLEELRETIAESEFRVRSESRPARRPRRRRLPSAKEQGRTIRLTVSIGVARSSRKRPTPQDVLDAADRALYDAKARGRNMVCAVR